ncbi:MAG: alpha/beta hydrolase [Candidatus Woesearchaeota archaeon]
MWKKAIKGGVKVLAVAVVAIIAIILISKSFNQEKEDPVVSAYWEVNNGLLSFTNIEELNYTTEIAEEGSWYIIYNITYMSRGKEIYAQAYVPRGGGLNKGIVTLHAAGATKEHHKQLDKKLLLNGYTAIAIDQRGHGMTGGESPSLQQDYERFLRNEEPIIYLYVYDALLAGRILRDLGAEDVAYFGESMGGRFAIIAAAMDENSSGVFAYSTGGIEVAGERTSFIDSIDPNKYADKISPGKIVIYHAPADDVIPIWMAEKLYVLAKEPKKFEPLRGTCIHGYCDLMDEYMFRDLEWIFSK